MVGNPEDRIFSQRGSYHFGANVISVDEMTDIGQLLIFVYKMLWVHINNA